MSVFAAIIVGLIVNYFSGGIVFSSFLCAVAGLFLIMPSLLNVRFGDLKQSLKNIKIISLNLLLNFIVLPILFFGIAKIFFGENPITYAFLLLGLLSGGGLSFSWVNRSKGDIKTAFSLFLLNTLIFAIIFIPLNGFLTKLGNFLFFNPQVQEKDIGGIFSLEFIPYTVTKTHCFMDNFFNGILSCFSSLDGGPSPIVALFVLIILPFIISRFILLSDKLTNLIKPYIKIISQISTFFIVAYIFSLKEVHNIFDVNLIYLTKIFLVLLIVYLISFFIGYILLKKLDNTMQAISLFWLSTTRFITLGMVFSFSFTLSFGLGFMIIFVLAYFIQIGLSIWFLKFITKKEA